MQLLNKYKVLLSSVFSLLVLFCFCLPTQAKDRSIILTPPQNLSPKGEVTEDKVIFEWRNDNIPREYKLNYYLLEVTSNINERGGDFNHGLSLKVEVDKAYTRFPPTGDGMDTRKLFTDTQGRFSWRVTAIYNCADGTDSEKSVPFTSTKISITKIDLTDLGEESIFKSEEEFLEGSAVKTINKLENDEYVCITRNSQQMVNIFFLERYLGCKIYTVPSSQNSKQLERIKIVRYEQGIDIFPDNKGDGDSKIIILNSSYGSDYLDTIFITVNNNIRIKYGGVYKEIGGIFIDARMLKWLGVNYLKFDEQSKVLKISDQGLKDPAYKDPNQDFALYDPDQLYDTAKGKFYIMPSDWAPPSSFVVNKNKKNPIPRNKLKYTRSSNSFNLRCPCSSELCNGFSLLHFKLLEGIAKLIVKWEETHPTSDLQISGSYRCKSYNITQESFTGSAHQFGLKADLDPVGNAENDYTFRNFCTQNNNWSGLKNYEYQEERPKDSENWEWIEWADLRYIGLDGPYFSKAMHKRDLDEDSLEWD